MNLTDFCKTYPDEEACERALRKYRECNTLYCRYAAVCTSAGIRATGPGHVRIAVMRRLSVQAP